MKNSIVIFTHSFPFGKGEAFLESELNYLAKRFDRVFLFPSNTQKEHRKIPENVEVINVLQEIGFRSLPEILIRNFSKVISVFLWTCFKRNNLKVYLRYYKSFLHYLLIDLNKYNTILREIKQRKLQNAIYYDYWFVNCTISLSILRKKAIIHYLICRTHRFDLYDECNFETKVSFRDFKIQHLDYVYTISKHGHDYLKSKIPVKYHSKVRLSYLGVDSLVGPNKKVPNPYDSRLVVVSCSRMIPSKRVELIPKVLAMVERPIKWIHFGDGPMFELVKSNADKYLSDEFKLAGSVENQSIHEFYANSKVDLFISLSISEGLPVSMMEAVAYGIPIFSIDAGGVNELVHSAVGVALPVDSSIELISQNLKNMINDISGFDRDEILKVYESEFSASKNYPTFIDEITKSAQSKL